MKDIYIVGAGGFGRELLGILLDIHNIQGQRWNIVGFLDDTENPLYGKDCDYGVVGTIVDYKPAPNDVLAWGIASPAAKRKLVPMLKERGAVFEQIIHPYSSLGRHTTLGEGVVVCGGFGMTVNVSIGNFVTLQACGLGHDVRIGDYCTISSHCHITGNVTLEDGVFVGGNSAIAPHVTVGRNAYLCMGSVVLKDVTPCAKVIGNPAREVG